MWASAGVGAFPGPSSEGISGPRPSAKLVLLRWYMGSEGGLRKLLGADRLSDMSEQQFSLEEASHLLLWGLSRHESWSQEVRSQVGIRESELISSCQILCFTPGPTENRLSKHIGRINALKEPGKQQREERSGQPKDSVGGSLGYRGLSWVE